MMRDLLFFTTLIKASLVRKTFVVSADWTYPCKPQVTLFRLKVDFYHAELVDYKYMNL